MYQNKKWEYPYIGKTVVDSAMGNIGDYITLCDNSVDQGVYTRPIFYMASTEERWIGPPYIIC